MTLECPYTCEGIPEVRTDTAGILSYVRCPECGVKSPGFLKAEDAIAAWIRLSKDMVREFLVETIIGDMKGNVIHIGKLPWTIESQDYLPKEVWVSGVLRRVKAVELFMHPPPWKKGELCGIVFETPDNSS